MPATWLGQHPVGLWCDSWSSWLVLRFGGRRVLGLTSRTVVRWLSSWILPLARLFLRCRHCPCLPCCKSLQKKGPGSLLNYWPFRSHSTMSQAPHPHLLYPQFKQVAHPSMITSAFVLHLWHIVALGGKLVPSPVTSMSSIGSG